MNKMIWPVSVIVPVFNTENYLQAALDSLYKQSLKGFEIICVNDGSTDSSRAILEDNKNKIRIVDKENGGLSSARNAGLAAAKGKYVYFFDSDDLLLPDALETMYLLAEQNELDIVYFEWARFYDDEGIKKIYNATVDDPLNGVYDKIYDGGELFSLKIKNNDFRTSACLRFFRRDFLTKFKLTFPEGLLHEDEQFSVISDVKAKRVMHCPQKLFRRRIRANSIMTAPHTEWLHSAFRFMVAANLMNHFSKVSLFPDVQKSVYQRIQSVMDSALWDYIYLSDDDKQKVRTKFQKETGKECEFFLHICDYSFKQGWEERNKKNVPSSTMRIQSEANANALFPKGAAAARKLGDGIIPEVRQQKNHDAPFVSVIVPVYNMEQYLQESLNSIAAQSLKETEIICVDDGSTDGSLEILSEYAARDPRFHVFHQPNSGVAAARNLGISKAHGDYLAFMDPDDFYPDCITLEKLYHAAKNHKVMICGGSVCWLKDGKIQERPDVGFENMVFDKEGFVSFKDYQYDYGFWRFIYNREFLLKNNLSFPPFRRFQDPPFMVKAFASADVFYALADPVYVYRVCHKIVNVFAMPIPKVLDIYSGNLELLKLSRLYGLEKLHSRVVNRLNIELIDIAHSAVYEGNRQVFEKLLEVQNAIDPQLLDSAQDSVLLPLKRILDGSSQYNHLTFSVVIPIYKTEQYLKDCIQYLQAQNYRRFEVVFVDDGSDGNSYEIIAGYHDPRFRYVRHSNNKGLLAARITGASLAKGEYLVHLDPDDHYAPDLLQNLSDAITKDPDVDVITYYINIVEGNTKSPFWANYPVGCLKNEEIIDQLLAEKLYWTLCGKGIKTSLYLDAIQNLNLDPQLHLTNTEDLLQFFPIACKAKKLVSIDSFGYEYVRHSSSVSMNLASFDKWTSCFNNVRTTWGYLTKFAQKFGLGTEKIKKLHLLQKGVVEWSLKLINGKSPDEWNKRFAVLHNTFYHEILYSSMYNRYLHCLYFLDFKDCDFPKSPVSPIRTVAILCNTMTGGGAERAVAAMIRVFSQNGIKVVLFCSRLPQTEDYSFPQVPRILLSDKELGDRWDVLKENCKKYMIDCAILVEHLQVMTYFDIVCLKDIGCKIVMQEHSSYFYPLFAISFFSRFFYRKPFYKLADLLTCLSPLNKIWWCEAGFRNTVYLPNFLTFSVKNNAPSELNTRNLLFIGRLTAIKGALSAVKMIVELRKSIPDVKLFMLGKFTVDADKEQFEKLVSQYDLHDNIEYPGFITDISSHFKKAAALIMCSQVEGAPMVLYEAKSYGVPTVLFDMPYVDCISEEDGAITVPQGDVCGMARVLTRLLGDDRSELKELGRRAYRSLDRFRDSVIMEKWRDVFHKLENNISFESDPVDKNLQITMEQYESSIRIMGNRVEEGTRMVGHAQWLSSELTKEKGRAQWLNGELTKEKGNGQYLSAELTKMTGHAQYLSAELTKMTGHAQYLSAELTKMTGHAQYLSAELAKYEQSRIIQFAYRLKTRIKKMIGKS